MSQQLHISASGKVPSRDAVTIILKRGFHPTQRTRRPLLCLRFGRCVSCVRCVRCVRCVEWKPRFSEHNRFYNTVLSSVRNPRDRRYISAVNYKLCHLGGDNINVIQLTPKMRTKSISLLFSKERLCLRRVDFYSTLFGVF